MGLMAVALCLALEKGERDYESVRLAVSLVELVSGEGVKAAVIEALEDYDPNKWRALAYALERRIKRAHVRAQRQGVW